MFWLWAAAATDVHENSPETRETAANMYEVTTTQELMHRVSRRERCAVITPPHAAGAPPCQHSAVQLPTVWHIEHNQNKHKNPQMHNPVGSWQRQHTSSWPFCPMTIPNTKFRAHTTAGRRRQLNSAASVDPHLAAGSPPTPGRSKRLRHQQWANLRKELQPFFYLPSQNSFSGCGRSFELRPGPDWVPFFLQCETMTDLYFEQ